MGPEAVVFRDHPPMGIDHGRPVFLRADSLLPVVLISKTTTGPTKIGNANVLQGLKHFQADTRFIGKGRIFSNPNAIVYTASKVLREMTINMPADLMIRTIQVYNHLVL